MSGGFRFILQVSSGFVAPNSDAPQLEIITAFTFLASKVEYSTSVLFHFLPKWS